MDNTRFVIAIHIITDLNNSEGQWGSSQFLVCSINANAAMVRKELGNLKEYGLATSKAGKYAGRALAKPAADIERSDIYKAVRQTPVLGSGQDDPNSHCPIGSQINDHLSQLYQETEETLINKLAQPTLANFCRQFK